MELVSRFCTVPKRTSFFLLSNTQGLDELFEVKNTQRIRLEDLNGLRAFGEDYPQAQLIFLYRGQKREVHYEKIHCIPVDGFLRNLDPGLDPTHGFKSQS